MTLKKFQKELGFLKLHLPKLLMVEVNLEQGHLPFVLVVQSDLLTASETMVRPKLLWQSWRSQHESTPTRGFQYD